MKILNFFVSIVFLVTTTFSQAQIKPLIPGEILPRPTVPPILIPTQPVKPNPPNPNDPWLPPPVYPGTGGGSICSISPYLPQCQNQSPICITNPTLPQCRGTGPIFVPGPYGQTDINGRPVILPAVGVPAEYDCPLFENRPHDGLIQAIDALGFAMNSTPECSQQRMPVETIQQNSQILREAIRVLQSGLTGNLGASIAPTNPGDLPPLPGNPNLPGSPFPPTQPPVLGGVLSPQAIEQNVAAAIQAATNISQIFGSNTLLQSRCGREMMSSGKVLIALNDIVNNLAPYALLAVGMNPASTLAAKFAVTGGAVVTSAISTMVKMFEQGTVDMRNPEHRKAVLKNTCQFTNIARKARFLQLAQSGQIQRITTELNKDLNAYQQFLSTRTGDLQTILSYKESIERIANRSEIQLRKDHQDLQVLEAQVSQAKNDDLYVCLMAQQMVRNSARNDLAVFPTTIVENFKQAVELAQVDQQSPQVVGTRSANDVARKRIAALEQRVQRDDGAAIKLCAQTAKSWVVTLRQTLQMTANYLNDEREKVEQELSTNPEYVTWREQYRIFRQEQLTADRLTRVMRELSKDNSVIDRSELDQRLTTLKATLFGLSKTWKWGHSPIQEWLNHTLQIQANRIGSFSENIQSLQYAAAEVIEFGKITGKAKPSSQKDFVARNRQLIEALQKAESLEPLNVQNIKPGTRGHGLACQMLETAWLDWSASLDHLGATEFMCDMIDAYLDNKVEKNLITFCRGEISFTGKQLVLSKIQQAKSDVAMKKSIGNKTYRDWAGIISKKIQELECPMPGASH